MALFIFLAIILVYWIIWYVNSDSYILDHGRKTEGVVTSVQSRSRTDQYGKVHVSYIVSYQFRDVNERIWRGKFTIQSSTCRFKEEDRIEVSYLPNKPHKNTFTTI